MNRGDEGDWECILRTQPFRSRNTDHFETVSQILPIELDSRNRRGRRPQNRPTSPPQLPLGPPPPPIPPLNVEVLAVAHNNQGERSGMMIRRDDDKFDGDVFYAYEENANPKESKTYQYDTYYQNEYDSYY